MTVPPPPDPLGPPTPPYGMAVPYPDAAWPAAAPPYPGPYPYPPYPYPPRRTNAMAIASLVCAFVFAPLAILFGHLSLSQIKRSGEEGRGMAIAGLVIGYIVTVGTVLMLVAGVLFFSWAAKVVRESPEFRGGARHSAAPPGDSSLPPFRPPAGLGACSYPPTATAAVKPVKPPRAGAVPTDPAVVDATLTFKDGTTEDVVVGLRLDNAKAPCTVNSFVSLAEQRFFDNTGCHRLTDSPSLAVLQCGDPTGSGAGGPGYRFANEYPTNQYRPFDPALKMPLTYPRGDAGDGQLRAGQQRQPVLHHLPGLRTSAHLHGVRQRRQNRDGGRRRTGVGRGGRWRPGTIGRQAEVPDHRQVGPAGLSAPSPSPPPSPPAPPDAARRPGSRRGRAPSG